MLLKKSIMGDTHTRDSVGGGGVVLASFVVERFPTPSPADLFPRQISHLIALQRLVEGRQGGGHLVSVVIVSLITIFCTHTERDTEVEALPFALVLRRDPRKSELATVFAYGCKKANEQIPIPHLRRAHVSLGDARTCTDR